MVRCTVRRCTLSLGLFLVLLKQSVFGCEDEIGKGYLQVTNVTSESAAVFWCVPYNSSSFGFSNVYFKICIIEKSEGSRCFYLNGSQFYHSFYNLTANSQYIVLLNVSGCTGLDLFTTFTTFLSMPPAPVMSHFNVSTGTVSVDIDNCESQNKTGFVTSVVQYKESGSTAWKGIESTENRAYLSSLKPNVTYDLRAYCYNDIGRTFSNQTSIATLPEDIPSQPFINVSLVAMTTRTIDTAIGSGCTTMESNAAITYVFQYKETTSEVWKGIETSNSSVTIPSLKAATTYDIRAYCYNSVGKSALSNKISEKTLSESSVIPATLIGNASADNVLLMWNKPTASDTLKRLEIRAQSPNGYSRTENTTKNSTLFLFSSLDSNTTYTFQIRAVISEEEVTSWSTPLSITTLPNVPSKVRGFSATLITTTTITVLWESLKDGADEYLLSINSKMTDPYHEEVLLNGRQTVYTFTGLQHNKPYLFQVQGVNKDGYGVAVTLEAVTASLQGVTKVGFQKLSNTSVSLNWTNLDEDVRGYEVILEDEFGRNLRYVNLAVTSYEDEIQYTIYELENDFLYLLHIIPWNDGGKASESTFNLSVSNITLIEGERSERPSEGEQLSVASLLVALYTIGTLLILTVLLLFGMIAACIISHLRRGRLRDADMKLKSKANAIELEENAAYQPIEMSIQPSPKTETIKPIEISNQPPPKTETIKDVTVTTEMESLDYQLKIAKIELLHSKMPKTFDPKKMKKETLPISVIPPAYLSQDVFEEKSGWFNPNLTSVLLGKLTENSQDSVTVDNLTVGVVMLTHRKKKSARFIGSSSNLFSYLYKIFKDLYKKEVNELTPIEVELKYFSPNAEDWSMTVWLYDNADQVSMATNQKLMEHCCLRPHGLNHEISWNSKEEWKEFASCYMKDKERL